MLASSSKLLDTNGMVNQAAALLSSTSSDFSDMALLVRDTQWPLPATFSGAMRSDGWPSCSVFTGRGLSVTVR